MKKVFVGDLKVNNIIHVDGERLKVIGVEEKELVHNTLYILTVENLEEEFKGAIYDLRYYDPSTFSNEVEVEDEESK